MEAVEAFKVSAENESRKRIREIMTDNMRDICECDSIKLRTVVPYPWPASNGIAEQMIRVLTDAMCACSHSGL